ncbi:MAG: AAA family ATPase [Sphingomonadaceae bacterium]
MNNKTVELSGSRANIARLTSQSATVLEQLRNEVRNARADERREPIFSIGRAGELVGRTPTAIRDAEKDGRLISPVRTATNRRVGYTLGQLNEMREVFGTRPSRITSDPLAVVAVQNFKGGVGKSTVSVHLAQFLAIKGYRVCLIDCDSQASATTLFGYVPDLDLTEDETLYPFLRYDDILSLSYAVKKTHFDGLDLVPSNLRLFQSEYELAARMATGEGALLNRLAEGILSIGDSYDIVVIDPPPALGAISLSVLRAANALVVPLPPTVMDFSSTSAFLSMLDETLAALAEHGFEPDLSFIRFLASKVDDNKSMQREMMDLYRNLFGHDLIRAPLKDSAEIDNATARLMTVYELSGPITSKSVRDRCLTYLEAVNSEIESEIRKTWPSHAEALRSSGLT